jgi:hypothetical protein
VYEEERLDAISALASRVNAQVFIDGDGVVQVTPLPSLDNPQFSYSLGSDSTLLSVGLNMTREGVYNAVIAKGEQVEGQAPLVSVATEVSGPAAWGGPFGRVPLFFSSSLMVATFVGRVKDVKIPLGAGGGSMEVALRLMSNRTVVKYGVR